MRLICLAFMLVSAAGSAWSKPICAPTKPLTRAQLYPPTDPYVQMPVAELEKLAGENNARAINALGTYYGTGRNVPKDSMKSFELYRRAADLGLATAQFNLAYMYLHGEGTQQDTKLAWSWAMKSVSIGHMRGQALVGYMLGTGQGVKEDRKEAAFCFLLSALQGNVDSQEQMVEIYRQGLGIPADPAAAELWRERARQGRATNQEWFDETPLMEMPAAWNTPPGK